MRSSIQFGAAILTAAFFGFVAPGANATPLTYDFTVTATSGPLNGVTADGNFTFDSSIIPAGGGSVTAPPLSTLNFTWDGITYTASTANIGNLGFDSSGALIIAEFGTNCTSGCGVTSGMEQWAFTWDAAGGFGDTFAYAISGTEGQFVGTTSLTRVPEPLTLSLFGVGLAGAAALRRRRKIGQV